jgi:putative transposase
LARLHHFTSAGSTYFVTTKAAQNTALFRVEEIAEIVVGRLLHYREKSAYRLHEFVLMPDHLHVLLTPAGGTSLEKCMQFIKGGSSFLIHKQRGSRGEIWQAGFHESTVRDVGDYWAKVRYIRQNPVCALLAEKVEEWNWGSGSGKFVMDGIPQGLKPRSR